jgi:hypothetical protein
MKTAETGSKRGAELWFKTQVAEGKCGFGFCNCWEFSFSNGFNGRVRVSVLCIPFREVTPSDVQRAKAEETIDAAIRLFRSERDDLTGVAHLHQQAETGRSKLPNRSKGRRDPLLEAAFRIRCSKRVS